jgi:hypothetical protein
MVDDKGIQEIPAKFVGTKAKLGIESYRSVVRVSNRRKAEGH